MYVFRYKCLLSVVFSILIIFISIGIICLQIVICVYDVIAEKSTKNKSLLFPLNSYYNKTDSNYYFLIPIAYANLDFNNKTQKFDWYKVLF